MSADVQSDLPNSIPAGEGITLNFLRAPEKFDVNAVLLEEAEFFVPEHYHLSHDEYIRVLKGKLELSRNGEVKVVTPEDGEQYIPKGTRHWLRKRKGWPEAIIEERTDPSDKRNVRTFRNLFQEKTPNIIETMVIFRAADSYPSVPGKLTFVESFMTNGIGGWLGPKLGYKLKYETAF